MHKGVITIQESEGKFKTYHILPTSSLKGSDLQGYIVILQRFNIKYISALEIKPGQAKIISESACSLGGEEVSPCIIWDELQYEAYLSEQENGVKWF